MIPGGMGLKPLVTDVLNMGSRHWTLVIINNLSNVCVVALCIFKSKRAYNIHMNYNI